MDNYMPVYKENENLTEHEKLLRRINTLKDKVLPVKHRQYMFARKFDKNIICEEVLSYFRR